MVLFIMLHKVVLTFESVDGILKCGHSNESYRSSSTFQWRCLFCCTWWFYLVLRLWMKCQSVTIQRMELNAFGSSFSETKCGNVFFQHRMRLLLE